LVFTTSEPSLGPPMSLVTLARLACGLIVWLGVADSATSLSVTFHGCTSGLWGQGQVVAAARRTHLVYPDTWLSRPNANPWVGK